MSLREGRGAYDRREWDSARRALSHAADRDSLAPGDLDRLAVACFMVGRQDDYMATMERAHAAHLAAGATEPAIRCAFWLGLRYALRDETARASGWLGRARRLLEEVTGECVEQGYMLLPMVIQAQASGDWSTAAELADDAMDFGRRYSDHDLTTLALHAKGLSHLKAGRLASGLGLLDEAMVAVVSGELSPIVTGIVYCSVIEGCRDSYELERAAEWTRALADWCDDQPDLVAFGGECLMYRADIMRLSGAWSDSLAEAERAQAHFEQTENLGLAARACYQQAEVLRVRGEFEAAMALYTEASRGGHEPQPGLALLRLAQGDVGPAEAAIRRVTGEARAPLDRVRLLPAYVQIALAAGDLEAARSASDELSVIANAHRTDMLTALAATARGTVRLAEGDGWAALAALRDAAQLWQALGTPYEAACVRELIGQACLGIGDIGSAELELDAARDAYDRLGARLEVARMDDLQEARLPTIRGAHSPETYGLTDRELEVLRLVSSGTSNREIAADLVISEHTVARHLQNIFAKIDVTSRTAAGAFAYEHNLVQANGQD